jgi:hypothetical protein
MGRALALTTVLGTALMVASSVTAQADPPSHAKAHGWRRKQESSRRVGHRAGDNCRDSRYHRDSDRYERTRYDRRDQNDRYDRYDRYDRNDRYERDRDWNRDRRDRDRDREWSRNRDRDDLDLGGLLGLLKARR